MRFSTFILKNLDRMVEEWVLFAREVSPAVASMSALELADHSREILTAARAGLSPSLDRGTA